MSLSILFTLATGFNPGHAEQLSLDSVLQQAVERAHTLKIAQVDVRISETGIKTARADYFPVLRGRVNVEYLRDMDDQFRPVTSVGDTIIPAGTRYQDSVGLNATQTLLDFGIRKRKVQIAKKDVVAKQSLYERESRDLRLKVIDLYAKTLLASKALHARQNILALQRQLFQMKERLYAAGSLPKVPVAEQAIQVARTLDEIQMAEDRLVRSLKDLSYFTRQDYDVDTTELADLEEGPAFVDAPFDGEQTPDARYYQMEAEKKQKEVELLRRQYLPSVAAYSYYNLYGFDPDSLPSAIQDLRQRTISGGLSITLPIFDGFKNQAAIERAKLELEKINLQKAQKIAELRHQYETEQGLVRAAMNEWQQKGEVLNRAEEKLALLNRLSQQQLIDKTVAYQELIERINQQAAVEKTLIERLAAIRKLRVLAEG